MPKKPVSKPASSKIPLEFYTFIEVSQSQYMDIQYSVAVNGKNVSFKQSDMTSASDYADKCRALKEQVDKALRFCYKDYDPAKKYYNVYKYKIGEIAGGQTAETKQTVYTAKSDRPKTENAPSYIAYAIVNSDIKQQNLCSASHAVCDISGSIDNERLEAYTKLITGHSTKSLYTAFYTAK